jgi:SAM-dependent methyltransferase
MLTKAEIRREVQRLGAEQPWWHDIELPFGVHTHPRSNDELKPNHNTVKWRKIRPLLNLTGKRVIDLACNEGFFSLEALRSNAAQVIGVDINEHRIKKARFVAQTLECANLQLLQEDIYRLTPDQVEGSFDVALCLGLMHRVPDPLGLLRTVGQMADTVVLEWAALASSDPIMEFWTNGDKQYDPDNSGYWRISRQCIKEMLWRVGFRAFYDAEPADHRAIMLASKTLSPEASMVPLCPLESSVGKISLAQRGCIDLTEIANLVKPGDSFILVDQWWGNEEPLPHCHAIPFMERNGQYWGKPSDDATAIRELERLREAGARHIVFAWPSFWWLEHYSGLASCLDYRFSCVLSNDRLIVYDLGI